MELKHTKQICIKVDYKDLDDFIRKTYGCDKYNFVADMELSNYSTWSHDVE